MAGELSLCLLLLGGKANAERAGWGKDSILLSPSHSREMVDRQGKLRTIAVPARARLNRVTSFSEGFLRFDFDGEVTGRAGENFWCEVYFGPSTTPGKWDQDVKLAILVLISGATGDTELDPWLRPGFGFVWRAGKPGLEKLPVDVSGRSLTLKLREPTPPGLVIGEACSHWYPQLGGEWLEPRHQQSRVSSAALKQEASMWFQLHFPVPTRKVGG